MLPIGKKHFMSCDFNNTCFLLNKNSSRSMSINTRIPMPSRRKEPVDPKATKQSITAESLVDSAFAMSNNLE